MAAIYLELSNFKGSDLIGIHYELNLFCRAYLGARTLTQVWKDKGNDVKTSLASGHFVIRLLVGVTTQDDFVIMSRNGY